eukprot:364581-Chlamydomonas_euryale.AAC.4
MRILRLPAAACQRCCPRLRRGHCGRFRRPATAAAAARITAAGASAAASAMVTAAATLPAATAPGIAVEAAVSAAASASRDLGSCHHQIIMAHADPVRRPPLSLPSTAWAGAAPAASRPAAGGAPPSATLLERWHTAP